MCTVNIKRLHTDTGVLKGSGSVGGQRGGEKVRGKEVEGKEGGRNR